MLLSVHILHGLHLLLGLLAGGLGLFFLGVDDGVLNLGPLSSSLLSQLSHSFLVVEHFLVLLHHEAGLLMSTDFVLLLLVQHLTGTFSCLFNLFPCTHLFLFEESDSVGEQFGITVDLFSLSLGVHQVPLVRVRPVALATRVVRMRRVEGVAIHVV